MFIVTFYNFAGISRNLLKFCWRLLEFSKNSLEFCGILLKFQGGIVLKFVESKLKMFGILIEILLKFSES